jgi:hypothetical protein
MLPGGPPLGRVERVLRTASLTVRGLERGDGATFVAPSQASSDARLLAPGARLELATF